MKIVHICLTGPYTDGWAYQDNILPKKHAELGLETYVIAPNIRYVDANSIGTMEPGEYMDENGVHIFRIPYKKWKFSFFNRYHLYPDYIYLLEQIEPDILFCHGIQFYSVMQLIRYMKKHANIKLFVDQHGDYINMPLNSLRTIIKQKCIFRYFAHQLADYAQVFWGVTPLRELYLRQVYRLKPEQTGLLVMGGDDEKIHFSEQDAIKSEFRGRYGIKMSDILIVTGGKIDERKNIHMLMEAVSRLDSPSIKLVVFGKPNDEMYSTIERLSQNKSILNIGWIKSDEAYDWFLASNLAVFPGTHSVLWEQAVACGIPCVFKHWNGMEHVDVGGNCQFLYEDSVEEIEAALTEIINNNEKYQKMKKVAIEKGIKEFSYLEIAKKAISIK